MSSCSGANWSRFSKTQRAGVICDVLHPSFYFARLVYQYPPFLRHPYRVESFRKIISFILIRLRTVLRSVLMDFMAKSSLAASSFFFKFPIYRAARTYRPRHERGCAPVSLASNGTRSSSCEITGKEA